MVPLGIRYHVVLIPLDTTAPRVRACVRVRVRACVCARVCNFRTQTPEIHVKTFRGYKHLSALKRASGLLSASQRYADFSHRHTENFSYCATISGHVGALSAIGTHSACSQCKRLYLLCVLMGFIRWPGLNRVFIHARRWRCPLPLARALISRLGDLSLTINRVLVKLVFTTH